MPAAGTSAPAKPAFSPQLRAAIVVTTLGAFMAFLDSTIVNVALEPLTVDLDASLSTIQWVITGYLLAMGAVIPVSGWAATRFGAAQTYTAALAAFTLASLLCGLAGSVDALIAARVLQGVAGGLLMPIGTMITMRAAKPEQFATVMAVSGVPTIMAPVFGPTVGGLLLDHAGWQWIFLINLPIGLLAVLLAIRLLPRDRPEATGRLDVPGLALIVGGSVAVTYGLAEIGGAGRIGAPTLWSIGLGAVLLLGFVLQQLQARTPLMDLRLFRNRLYAAASVTNFFVGAVIFGGIILMPLYLQIVRQESSLTTGLLLMPQGLGVAAGMILAARLADRIGAGWAGLTGGWISIAGTLPFAFVAADTSYWLLSSSMLIRGLGVGLLVVPVMSATYRAISADRIPDATVQLNVGQRLGGSAATAAFAVILQNQLDTATTPAAAAAGFGTAFWWVVGISVGCTTPLLLLISAERRTGAEVSESS